MRAATDPLQPPGGLALAVRWISPSPKVTTTTAIASAATTAAAAIPARANSHLRLRSPSPGTVSGGCNRQRLAAAEEHEVRADQQPDRHHLCRVEHEQEAEGDRRGPADHPSRGRPQSLDQPPSQPRDGVLGPHGVERRCCARDHGAAERHQQRPDEQVAEERVEDHRPRPAPGRR